LDAHPILCFGLVDGHSHEVSEGTSAGGPILVHDDLQGIDFYNFGDFILHFEIFVCIFHDFLNDPASVAVQTHKKKLFLCHFVDELLLPFAPHL
jgi:hypothetical protein